MKRGRNLYILIITLSLVITVILLSSAKAIITGETVTGEAITGEATSQPTQVSIYVTPTNPILSIISPQNKTYLINESILLNYSVTRYDSIWYNLDNLENLTITSTVYFNTTQGSHTLYLFANNTDGVTKRNISFSVNSTKLIIYYLEYNGTEKGNSTDFISHPYEDLQSLENVTLENVLSGKIFFKKAINLTEDDNPADNIVDIDANTNISFNRIEINPIALPNFNKTATLYLYNLSFTNPRVLRDGNACPPSICSIENYSSGTLRFNVTSFSVYSAGETPVVEEEVPLVAGGGGGGGAAKAKAGRKISIDKDKIKVSLKQGETKKEKITIKNTDNKKIQVKLNALKIEEFVKISETSFELEAGSSKTIFLDFIAREDAYPDLYMGKIIVSADDSEEEILIAVEIKSKIQLFDVKVTIPEKFLTVAPGGQLVVEIRILNLGEIGRLDLKIEFFIKNEEGETIFSEEEMRAIEIESNFIKTFEIPKDIKPGGYIIYVRSIYKEEVSSASAWFSVGKEYLLARNEIIFSVIIIFMIISLLLVLYELKKLKKYSKLYRKIDENVLAKEKIIKINKKGGG